MGNSSAQPPGPRVAPGTRAQIGLVNAGLTRIIGLAVKGKPPHIFTTLARHRGLFRRWLWFAGGLMPGGKLPRVDTELVILRVSHNTDCEYERRHHRRIGRQVGLTEEEIDRVADGPDGPGWTPRQALFLRAADEMHTSGEIGDSLWSELAAELDDRLLIELCLLIGHYEMLAMTLKSLRVQPE